VTDAPYEPCPHSMVPDGRGEAHPHQMGIWYVGGQRFCAVCELPVPQDVTPIRTAVEDTVRDIHYRAEVRAILARITDDSGGAAGS